MTCAVLFDQREALQPPGSFRAGCLHNVYNREKLYHYLLFPPYFLPGFQDAQTLAFWVFSQDSTLIGLMEEKCKD